MRTIVTARNTDVGGIREVIERRFARLRRFEPRAARAEVVFTREKTEIRATAVVSIDRGKPVYAEGTGPDPRTALDHLARRLVNQLRRSHGNQLRRKHGRQRGHAAVPLDKSFG